MNFLQEKERVNIIVVEPSSVLRQTQCEILKDYGFENIRQASSISQAMEVIEVEPIHWVVTPFESSGEHNIYDLLNIAIKFPERRQLRVSALIDPELEESHVLKMFELGLFSLHDLAKSKENFINQMEELLDIYGLSDSNEILVSADYLRSYLERIEKSQERIQLDQRLLDIYPGSVSILISLAKAHLAINDTSKAQEILNQVLLLNPRLLPACKRLASRHGIELGDTESLEMADRNPLAIEKVVIVDPDTDVLHNLEEKFKSVGIQEVHTFESGKEAVNHLELFKPPQIILHEWRIPDYSGPVFTQKCHKLFSNKVPVVVISSLLRPQDQPLLNEMGVFKMIPKPILDDTFFQDIVHVLQQQRNPTEHFTLERRIFGLFDEGMLEEAHRLLSTYFSDSRISQPNKMSMQAHYEYYSGNFHACKEIGLKTFQTSTRTLPLLYLVGKALLRLGEYEEALTCFEQAQDISPLNLDRLLAIASVNMELGNKEEAEDAIERGLAIAPDDKALLSKGASVEAQLGDPNKAQSVLEQLETGDDFIRNMNNLAIAKIRGGKFEEALSTYQNTIAAIPDSWDQLLDVVQFNLALGYARYGDLEATLDTLDPLLSNKTSAMYRKADALSRKVERSLETAQALHFSTLDEIHNDEEQTEQSDESARAFSMDLIRSSMSIEPGDLCCHLIYPGTSERDAQIEKLSSAPPKFKIRPAKKK